MNKHSAHHPAKHKHIHHAPAHVTVFIETYKETAKLVGQKYNIPASVILAQSALESSWGKDAPGNMFFGIKGSAPDGNSVKVTTHEETSAGNAVKIQDNFRAYQNYESAAEDYAKLITTNQKYAGALLHRTEPYQYIDKLAKIYATDHNYAAKLKSIIKTNNLTKYDENPK
jgi:flagellum-specific peptidoglycan hydrolase FlgJ